LPSQILAVTARVTSSSMLAVRRALTIHADKFWCFFYTFVLYFFESSTRCNIAGAIYAHMAKSLGRAGIVP